MKGFAAGKKAVSVLMAAAMIAALPAAAYAAPPGGGSSGGSAPGSSSSSSVTWTGATEITSAASADGQTYSSTTAGENALLVNTSDSVTITNPVVTKSGGTSAGDNESFYGTNSAVMCKGGGTTTISGANITTDAAGANGVFSFGGNASTNATSGDGTKVIISDSVITTTGSGSGGIMTTGQGTTEASDLTIKTSGASSAAIRSDRGGGTVNVTGGTYETSGVGSPAVYATATITVNDATLTSTASQGIVNEGGNTVILNNCTVNAGNSTRNGQDMFNNGIFLYQSMSGDASDGASVFTMNGGTLNNTYGHVFHVTNTSAAITLNGVAISNTDSEGVLLSVCDDAWSGLSNKAALSAEDQTLEGTILVGSDSTANISLSGTSVWTGTTSGNITSHKGSTVSSSLGTVNVTLSDSAKLVLSDDTTVTSISGTGSIDYNGHTLTVGSKAYTSGCPGVSTITEVSGSSTGDNTGDNTGSSTEDSSGDSTGDTTQTEQAEITAVTLSAKTFTYTGKVQKPDVKTVKAGDTVLTTDDYTVTYKDSKDENTASKAAGEYTVTVTGKGNYTGSITTTYRIKKAANPLTVSGQTVTLKYSKLQTADRTLKRSKIVAITTKGKGTLTYKLASAKKGSTSYKKYFTVDASTGKLTVKKGLPKGTYTLKIKVKAAGTANFKASAYKTATVRVKVS